jgi:undecaprenyl phosphate-alpha-L-ara4FN deformylase
MLRSGAAHLYGWDIVLAGTFWPGREIGNSLHDVMRATEAAGHEVGLHAWDHHKWQVRALHMSETELRAEIARGVAAFCEAMGRPPDCSAAAGWICDERVLAAKEEFGFRYNSDCRGRTPFVPVIGARHLTPQVPTTLPTYDEVIGRAGVTDETYNTWILEQVLPRQLNVLTIHAEVEGISRAPLFDSFLATCAERSIRILPVQSALETEPHLPLGAVRQGPVPGRDGNVCWQSTAASS